MVKVFVKNNTTREEVIKELSATPLSVFSDQGIDISGSQVNLNGTVLTSDKFNQTFEQLGVTDGATVYLTSVVKADGARA